VLAAAFAILLALVALWGRGNAAERKAKKAREALKGVTDDAQTIMGAFDIRLVGQSVEFGENRSLLVTTDAAVVAAVKRMRERAK
jgi:hypothetical protein